MSAARPLARALALHWSARLAPRIPPAIDAQTRMHIADATGIALAGAASAARAVDARRDPMAAWLAASVIGSHGACRVLGRTTRLPPLLAAGANAALIHALDFDDIHDAARLHPTVVTLPAALAAADVVVHETGMAQVDRVLGARVVAAVALGNELACRLGLWISPRGSGPGAAWFLTQLLGVFSAAYAAGHVLGFDVDAHVRALGLASMQAAGAKEAGFGVGSNARAIYPAFAASDGVHAALLARAGLAGPEAAFDGAAGLFPVYLGTQFDASRCAAERAGVFDPDRWAFAATDIKPWPCCRLAQPYVAVARALRDRHGPRASDPSRIARIVVAVNESAARLCTPLPDRARPATLQDAKYSVPYMTAFALAHERVTLDTLDASSLHDARVLALAQRIEIDRTLPDGPGHPPARVAVHGTDGSVATSAPMPDLAMSADAVRAKFSGCLAFAKRSDVDALWRCASEGRPFAV